MNYKTRTEDRRSRRMRPGFRALAVCLSALFAAGCPDSSSDAPEDTDPMVADTETDSNTDANLDTGTDSDTGTESVPDTATDSVETTAFELMTRNPVDGTLPDGLYNSGYPALTPDGRFVAFESSQTALVSPPSNGYTQIFLFDRQNETLEIASLDWTGAPGGDSSYAPALSADGCRVVFYTAAALTPEDINDASDLYMRDRCSDPTGLYFIIDPTGNGQSANPSVSGDGRFVAYDSQGDVFLYDANNGESLLISESVVNIGEGGNYGSGYPSISADGTRIAFWSYASDLVASDTNDAWDIFLYDSTASPSISLVSVDSGGVQRNQGNESASRVVEPFLSADGRFVSFATTSDNLVTGDTNGFQDVFVRDTVADTTARVSVTADGSESDGDSPQGQGERAAMSADGSKIIFTSMAKNLTGSDTGNANVVMRDIAASTTSVFAPEASFGVGERPAISADSAGCFVAFFSSDPLDLRFDSAGVFFHDHCSHPQN